MHQWAVVRTHPGAERKALKHLDRQEFASYFPQYRETVVRRGRRVDVEQYLFPSYGFVDTASGAERSLRGTRGIAEMLGGSTRVDGFVAMLQSRSDALGFVTAPASPGRVVGDRVRIELGPLAGYRGTFDGQTSQQRVFVLLRLMGRTVRARVNEVDLAA